MIINAPLPDCPLCPRLADFREQNKKAYPNYFNAPVPSFGGLDAQLLIVGLAPGLKGANQTGRPFTGDYAGFILYPSLQKHGFAFGDYMATLPDSGLSRAQEGLFANTVTAADGVFGLVNTRISNAVRCVPPENKPEPLEIKTCNQFLSREVSAMPKLKVILSLGLVSHNAVLRAFGLKLSQAKFVHGATYTLTKGVTLLDSYHCSRYNINTGTLTPTMFDEIIASAKQLVANAAP